MLWGLGLRSGQDLVEAGFKTRGLGLQGLTIVMSMYICIIKNSDHVWMTFFFHGNVKQILSDQIKPFKSQNIEIVNFHTFTFYLSFNSNKTCHTYQTIHSTLISPCFDILRVHCCTSHRLLLHTPSTELCKEMCTTLPL